jgi:saccharopine dehydrogenase-like NADP-dependent oxidoreductase
MPKIVVYGAGRLGVCVASLLAGDGRAQVHLVDASEDALEEASVDVPKIALANRRSLDLKDSHSFDTLLSEGDIIVAAGADYECLPLASVALRNRCYYLDFNESASSAGSILKLEGNGISALIPSCGFSPGLQAALIADFTAGIKESFDLNVYAGVIPKEKTNRLGYGLVTNVEGLLQEYLSKALIKESGIWRVTEPLSLKETIAIEGEVFEAFTTGGTTNGLPHAVAERVYNYTYRTLRYPGHLDYIKFLLEDLKLNEQPYSLSRLLRNGLSPIEHDQAILHLSATTIARRYGDETRQRTWRIEGRRDEGGVLYEIAARHAAAMIDLIESGVLAGRGPLRQEDIDPSLILSSPQIRSLFT